MTGAQYCPVQFFFISHLSPPQMLLAHGTTKGNLQGDLGNTPMMLACSINNCTALRMLVRLSSRDIQPRLTANSAAAEKECSQFVFPLHLPPFFFIFLPLPKLKQGAKLCVQNKLGHYPIHAAAFAGARKALEVILTSGTARTSLSFSFSLNKTRERQHSE